MNGRTIWCGLTGSVKKIRGNWPERPPKSRVAAFAVPTNSTKGTSQLASRKNANAGVRYGLICSSVNVWLQRNSAR